MTKLNPKWTSLDVCRRRWWPRRARCSFVSAAISDDVQANIGPEPVEQAVTDLLNASSGDEGLLLDTPGDAAYCTRRPACPAAGIIESKSPSSVGTRWQWQVQAASGAHDVPGDDDEHSTICPRP